MAQRSSVLDVEDPDHLGSTGADTDGEDEIETPKAGSESPMDSESASPNSGPSTPSPQRSPSPTKAQANGQKKPGPQLIDYLPRAEEDALQVFEELEKNHYQYSTLGRSREANESMTCDCQFVPGEDEPYIACGDGSDCINRLTQVECIEGDCRCRGYCQNQRMQRRQHAKLEIVSTEKKGFGLRAGTDIDKDAFIYEYIGDVVSQPSFAKRMRDYADEGIRHFYFMMLQKDEFIDATKRGGIGRFANHSCNPNCYVAKWSVGKHVRMGIYAKRKIKKGEEITFNYNVDRYGHEAQPCYCGEANCTGFLGGKTQTDVAAMDDLYLDALGISDEVEMYGLKGSKKKKGKKLDEDYTPILKPLTEKDVPKVVQAVRQTQSRKVLVKLLSRIKMTEDQSALRQFMRLRGLSLMCNILEDFIDDVEICTIVMEAISTWPLLQRNKIEDSKIEEPILKLGQTDNEQLKELSGKLIAQWSTLEVGYRIPKRIKNEDDRGDASGTLYADEVEESIYSKRKRLEQEEAERASFQQAANWENFKADRSKQEEQRRILRRQMTKKQKPFTKPPRRYERWMTESERKAKEKAQREYELREEKAIKKFERTLEAKAESQPGEDASSSSITSITSTVAAVSDPDPAPTLAPAAVAIKASYELPLSVFRPARLESAFSLIEQVRLETEKAQAAAAREEKRAVEEARKAVEKEKERLKKKPIHLTAEEKEALKEKKLQKLISPVIVKCMSKHREQMSHDDFKRHAKELTQIISDKEKKSQSYLSGKFDSLSDDKTIKIKKFAKEYIAKLLRRLEKSKSSSQTPSLASTSSATPLSDTTPRSESNTLVDVEFDALDITRTPDFEEDFLGASKSNGFDHDDVDRMSVDVDTRSINSTPLTATPNPGKRSRPDDLLSTAIATDSTRSPSKDPRARRDFTSSKGTTGHDHRTS